MFAARHQAEICVAMIGTSTGRLAFGKQFIGVTRPTYTDLEEVMVTFHYRYSLHRAARKSVESGQPVNIADLTSWEPMAKRA